MKAKNLTAAGKAAGLVVKLDRDGNLCKNIRKWKKRARRVGLVPKLYKKRKAFLNAVYSAMYLALNLKRKK